MNLLPSWARFLADPQWSFISAWCPRPPPHPHALIRPPPPISHQSTMIRGRGHLGKRDARFDVPPPALGVTLGSWGWYGGGDSLQPVGFTHMHHSPRAGPLLPTNICTRGFLMPDLALNSKLKTAWQMKKEIVIERKKLCILVPLTATFTAFWRFSSCNGLHELSSQFQPSLFWCSIALSACMLIGIKIKS